ncbi:MAG: histidinol-phosphate transaminase [Bacteroidaceae bacterium]|nr:histidinol-phosphate transaminase [Bacteroidaceae bacterium]
MKKLQDLVRPNIWALKPYSCARDEFKGVKADVHIDANENPYDNNVNRYPDPLQDKVKAMISPLKNVPVENIFLGNGSDEAIDLPFRIFCRPGKDNVVAIEPTYGMYQVCAETNDVEYRKVLLDENYNFSPDALLSACDENTKIIFICSPNNPTGNAFPRENIEKVLNEFQGIVIVDEAYADFSPQRSFRQDINKYPNLIVLNTFSKAWGAAGIRLGMAFASTDIIGLFNKVKYPYNVNILTQKKAIEILSDLPLLQRHISMILDERETLKRAFETLPICEKLYPTDANFFLAKVTDADKIYHYLVEKGIIVRNRNRVTLCQGCLRITIGTKDENTKLLSALRQYK